jgi:hypothetical protein
VYTPKDHHHLKTLKHIYSTGSPLAPTQFDWVYQSIKQDVLLGSITGMVTLKSTTHSLLLNPNLPQAARISAASLPDTTPLCPSTEAKFNAGCLGWPSRRMMKTVMRSHEARRASWCARGLRPACLWASGRCRDSGLGIRWKRLKRDIRNRITAGKRAYGVSLSYLYPISHIDMSI